MKIASAQINCSVGKIESNLQEHYRMINTAIDKGVDLILFPEMSITGYCREEGHKLAFTKGDNRLTKLKELSSKGQITIVVGVPLKIGPHLFIGTLIISPNQQIEIYTKQFLHDGEEKFYSSSEEHNPIIKIEKESFSFAICADINHAIHAEKAKLRDTTVYLPSIFYSKSGINDVHVQLGKYAKEYSFNILMSNYSGNLWNMASGGHSAFWNSKGELIDCLNTVDSGLLIAEKNENLWKVKKLVTTRYMKS